MAVLHDLKCIDCGQEYYDELTTPVGGFSSNFCPAEIIRDGQPDSCRGRLEIRWDMSKRKIGVAQSGVIAEQECAVVYKHPVTGHVTYPGTNDRSKSIMSRKYEQRGYERIKLDSIQKLDKFCKDNNVMNHTANFDRSGHADDY